MENLFKNAKDLYDFKNKIINTVKKVIEGSTESDKIDLNWTFKKKESEEKLKVIMKDAEKEKDRFKEIPDSLIRFITEVMFGNIKSERITI